MSLSESRPDWVQGFVDEVWWSRLAQPNLHAWVEGKKPLGLQQKGRPRNDPDPKALACYGLLVRRAGKPEQMLLRFVKDRPVSPVTPRFLNWCCERLTEQGVKVWVLVWDNASWHYSQEVREWLRQHNRKVKKEGRGTRILTCFLPSKSPWLNPIEPKWVHGKRAVVEPARLLNSRELVERVCAYYRCAQETPLDISEDVS